MIINFYINFFQILIAFTEEEILCIPQLFYNRNKIYRVSKTVDTYKISFIKIRNEE